MNRRSALQLSGATLASFLGGCSTLKLNEPATVTVSGIVLRNRLDREIDVSVLLLDAGDVAYWRTVAVPTGPSPFANLDDTPEASGEYVLYSQVPTSEGEPTIHADLTEDAEGKSCIKVDMDVATTRVNGEKIPAVAYGTIKDCRPSA